MFAALVATAIIGSAALRHTAPFKILTGWLDTTHTRDDSRMRLYGVRKLSELDGQFFLHTRCANCSRRACFWAKDLQARLPMHLRRDADLDTVKDLFKCSACGARKPTVWAMSTPIDEEEQFDDLIDFT